MTTRDLNLLKNKLLQKNFNSLDSITNKAELLLANAILDEAAKLIADDQDKLIGSTGNVVTISQAIERAFQKFRTGPQSAILKEIIRSFSSIGALNETYFRTSADDKKKYDALVNDVEKQLFQRAGIDSTGNLVRGGFLYNLVNDTSIKAGIQAAAQQGIVSNLTFPEYLKMLRVTIAGTPDLPGPVTQHYRTFAHDAYMVYDSAMGEKIAQDLELRYFVYQGGLIETSREFCRRKNGFTFTKTEAEENWPKDPTLLKTKDEKATGVLNYNPINDRGRWNCRHHLNWITLPEGAKDLMKQGKGGSKELDELGKSMAKKYDGEVTPLNYKSEASIIRKTRDDYGGYYKAVKDTVRNTLVIPNDSIPGAMAQMRKDPRAIKVKQQQAKDDPLGYSGNLVNLKMENGAIVEMQINTARIIYAKDEHARSIIGEDLFNQIARESGQPPALGHKYYEEWRVLNKSNPSDLAKALEIERKSKEYYSHFY